MKLTQPLRFAPLMKRALWGGERLGRELGKPTDGATDIAESWEVCDLPGNVSVVSEGPFQGRSLRELQIESAVDLLGTHKDYGEFPLLIKFLDAKEKLSLQVHPKDPTRLSDGSLRSGKAEAWIVLEANPGSRMTLGLKPGVSQQELRQAIDDGNFDGCLNFYQPRRGDCIYLQPGTVHALGGGILVAEIQQPSDITYRLHDWGRVDSRGRPRKLHIEQGLAAIDFAIGPVQPGIPQALSARAGSECLLECPYFTIHRHGGPSPLELPDDDKMHVLIVMEGSARQGAFELARGETVVVPAARTESAWELENSTILIDAFLPG